MVAALLRINVTVIAPGKIARELIHRRDPLQLVIVTVLNSGDIN